ncbi:glmZ(sRNA)-inactivating NTPase [Pseudovibrio axinellae]|uniref:GlmZ(SRNA)-inactivating NTPase n=1 Tax=Pseudovibrio axinellae TaxID=989403 RepID=A0A161XHM9_9HYPH|nr:AAA family ATPase [Pseudovibrio axinellae]KZL21423.1 glmZ(sRNA)-inactivating NTPase [Pseudovibrio axinellae]SEQ99736.1 Predicted ATPase [Pseudovibrio axinellae]
MPIYVITGASGAGKSTLLKHLGNLGFRCQDEIGRQLIKDELHSGGSARPDMDPTAFRDKLFARSIEAFDAVDADVSVPVFFDRSFIEAIAYSRIIGAPVCDRMKEEARSRRFSPYVFVCAPWPEIFTGDDERQHDFLFAQQDYEANIWAYKAYGYSLVEVPQSDVAARVKFVAEYVSRHEGEA